MVRVSAPPEVHSRVTDSQRPGEWRCRACGQASAHRSRTRWFGERWARALTGYTPVRCDACGRRAWLRQRRGSHLPAGEIAFIVVVCVVATSLTIGAGQCLQSMTTGAGVRQRK